MFVEMLVTVSSLTISASLAFLFSSFYLFMEKQSYKTETSSRLDHYGLVLGHMNNKVFKQPVIKGILDKSFLAFNITGETILGSIYIFKGYSIMLVLGSDTDLMKQIIDIYDPHIVFSINKMSIECYAEYKRKGFYVCKRRATNRDLRYSFKKHILYDLYLSVL